MSRQPFMSKTAVSLFTNKIVGNSHILNTKVTNDIGRVKNITLRKSNLSTFGHVNTIDIKI